jgi:hypothetical protein
VSRLTRGIWRAGSGDNRRSAWNSPPQTAPPELNDLDQYRDVLAGDDIAAVRRIQVVGAARADLHRVRRTTTWVYLGSAVAILVVGGLLILNHHKTAPAAPPSPASTSPTSAPATR